MISLPSVDDASAVLTYTEEVAYVSKCVLCLIIMLIFIYL